MLTSKDDEIDEILGFNLGADDYMHKPFRPAAADRAREGGPAPRRRRWTTRVLAPMAGSAAANGRLSRAIKRGKLTLDPARHDCLWDGQAR